MPLNPLALLKLARAAAPEQKMLQGVYRGFAGDNAATSAGEQLFAANQRQLADYYAARRAAQTGEDPHVEMLLIDPEVGRQYRLHPPGAREMSRVRKLPPEAVQGTTRLYAKGGEVKGRNVLKDFKDPYAAERAGPSQLTRQHPELSGFLEAALMGTAPDEMGSVLDPLTARRRAGAEYGFPVGTVAQVAPALGPLSKLAATGARAGARNLAVPSTLGRQAGVIKAPGGNWLSGSVEDALKPLRVQEEYGGALPARIQEFNYTPEQAEAVYARGAPQRALNNWIDKQLTRYVKSDMATERDPIRALAERNVSHLPIADLEDSAQWIPEHLGASRREAGFPPEGLARSQAAKGWEGAADVSVGVERAGDFLRPDVVNRSILAKVERDPWLAKVPPETPVYSTLGMRDSDLGFSHLIDELRNATNPASGLPRELLLKYESLPQVSVPQAVERVAAINAWRAAQKAELNVPRRNERDSRLHHMPALFDKLVQAGLSPAAQLLLLYQAQHDRR